MSPDPRLVGARLPAGWRARVPAAWLESWEPQRFALDGGNTEVVVMGDGPPLLFLPPLPGIKEAGIRLAPLLARRHRVVVPDLRVRFDGAPRWESLVADLARVADAFAPGPAIVVGHSLGGALAQQWALAHPERVAALVLSSSFARVHAAPGTWAKRWLEQPLVLASQRALPAPWALAVARSCARRGRWVYDARCDDAVLELARLTIATLGLRDALAPLRLAFAHDTRARLAGLRVPTLVVTGEREAAWMGSAAAELVAGIAGAGRRTLAGVGHLHPLSAPERLAGAIEEWLAPGAA